MKNEDRLTYREHLGKYFAYYRDVSAKERGLAFELSLEQFEALTMGQACHYCGQRPGGSRHRATTQDRGTITFVGIDRKDNSVGYTVDNCVSCCRTCNQVKGALSMTKLRILKDICNRLIPEKSKAA